MLLSSACRKDINTNSPLEEINTPAHFPEPVYKFQNIAYSENRFELGKALFYDPILSSDNSISCSSCHHQQFGFSDYPKKFSFGVNDSLGTRNSPALFNLSWNTSFMWDGGINHIEVMPFAPITASNEMNEDMNEVIAKLQASTTYPLLFKFAFGDTTVTDQRVLWALAQYMSQLVSSNSLYDDVFQGKAQFNSTEQEGYQLFKTNCATCHSEPLLSNFSFQNNGLDTVFADLGRGKITQNTNDNGKFKVPSLRNIELTGPYMHDGRFETLEEVVNHYSTGIKTSFTVNPIFENGFNFNENEKHALIAFLKSLTDYEYISNTSF